MLANIIWKVKTDKLEENEAIQVKVHTQIL